MRAETLVCLGGPKDREVLTVPTDRWHIVFHTAPPLTIRAGGSLPRWGDAIQVEQIAYTRSKVRVNPDEVMTPTGYIDHTVLTPSGMPLEEADLLLQRDHRPIVDGGHRRLRDGQPGLNCTDPRRAHSHWCGMCGAEQWFSRIACRALKVVPVCPRCGEQDWRTEIDALTAPDYREATRR